MRAKHTSNERISFMCLGCGRRHVVQVGEGTGPRWSWNGSLEMPTSSPSVLVTWNEPSDNPDEFDDTSKDVKKVCHTFVRNGQIEYLSDCTHSLAGKTIDLPELEEDDVG